MQKHQAGLTLLWQTRCGAARCHEMGQRSGPAPPEHAWDANHSPWGPRDTPWPPVCWQPPAAGEPPPAPQAPGGRRCPAAEEGPFRPCRSQHLAH